MKVVTHHEDQGRGEGALTQGPELHVVGAGIAST